MQTDCTPRLKKLAEELEDILYLLDRSYSEPALLPRGIAAARLGGFIQDAFDAIDSAIDETK